MGNRFSRDRLAEEWPFDNIGLAELLAAGGVAFLYATFMAGYLSSADGNIMFWQAMSLALRHSLHFAWPAPGPGFLAWDSKYGIGLSLLYVPGIVFLQWIHPSVVQHAIPATSPYTWRLFALVGAPVQIMLTAGTALLVAATVRLLDGGRGLALLGLLIYGVASPAIVYARLDFAQPLEAFCYMLSIWASIQAGRGKSRRWVLLAAAALCYGVLSRPVDATVLVPTILVLSRRPGPGAIVLLGWALGVAGTLFVNWLRMGNPMVTGYGNEGFTSSLLAGVSGSLFSPARGLLWELPIVFLMPLGVWRMWLSGHRLEAAALLYTCLAMLLVVAKWHPWWGGYNWGLRLFLPAMPVATVLGTVGVRLLPRWLLPVVGVIALAGTLWAIPGLLQNGFLYESMAGNTAGSNWQLMAYPPFGAWQFIHTWMGAGKVGGTTSVDVLWLSLSSPGHLAPLAIMAAFGVLAMGLLLAAVVAWRLTLPRSVRPDGAGTA